MFRIFRTSLSNIAKKAEEDGVEIFISRGGTLLYLQNYNIRTPIIEIPVSNYDMLNAIHKAKTYGKNICVIGFENIVRGVEGLAPILDINIMAH